MLVIMASKCTLSFVVEDSNCTLSSVVDHCASLTASKCTLFSVVENGGPLTASIFKLNFIIHIKMSFEVQEN